MVRHEAVENIFGLDRKSYPFARTHQFEKYRGISVEFHISKISNGMVGFTVDISEFSNAEIGRILLG